MADLRAAWSKAYEQLVLDNNENQIRGITSNIISLLLKAGGDPSSINRWTDEHGAKWVMSGALVSPDVVAASINRFFFTDRYRCRYSYTDRYR